MTLKLDDRYNQLQEAYVTAGGNTTAVDDLNKLQRIETGAGKPQDLAKFYPMEDVSAKPTLSCQCTRFPMLASHRLSYSWLPFLAFAGQWLSNIYVAGASPGPWNTLVFVIAIMMVIAWALYRLRATNLAKALAGDETIAAEETFKKGQLKRQKTLGSPRVEKHSSSKP